MARTRKGRKGKGGKGSQKMTSRSKDREQGMSE